MRNIDLEISLVDCLGTRRARFVANQIAVALPLSRLAGIVYTNGALGALAGNAVKSGAISGAKSALISAAPGAISAIAAGATVGSVVPVVGTIIGAVLGAVYGLTKKTQSRAEATWDGYKKNAGKYAGTDYDEKGFSDVIKGGFDANRSALPYKAREEFLRDYAAALVAGLKVGVVPLTATIQELYDRIGAPWLKSHVSNSAAFDKNAMLRQLFVDLTERYTHNIPITRADMPTFKASKEYTVHAPAMIDALKTEITKATGPQVAIPNPVNLVNAQQVVKDLITAGKLPVSAAGIAPSAATAAIVQAQLQAQGVPAAEAVQLSQSIATTGLQPAVPITYPPSIIMTPASTAPDSAMNPPEPDVTLPAIQPQIATAGLSLPSYWPLLALGAGAFWFVRSKKRR